METDTFWVRILTLLAKAIPSDKILRSQNNAHKHKPQTQLFHFIFVMTKFYSVHTYKKLRQTEDRLLYSEEKS